MHFLNGNNFNRCWAYLCLLFLFFCGITCHFFSGSLHALIFLNKNICAGDQRTSAFGSGDLRRSLDWVCNRWNHIKDRPDVVNSILSEQGLKSADGAIQSQVGASTQDKVESLADEFLSISMIKPCSEPLVGRTTNLEVPDLAQDNSLANLKWSSSRKRRRSRERLVKGGLDCKRRCDGSSSSSQDEDEPSACNSFVIPKSLKVDHENCKYGGNPLFPGALPTLSSLVMSQ